MASRSLADWLQVLEQLHPAEIELGLERVGEVARRMGVDRPAPRVVTVAGTNGKGSVGAFIEAILAAHGQRVACYSSPHLLHFRERIRIHGAEATDHDIVTALERVEEARGDVSLTFFEFTTLAILDLIRRKGVDTAVLEVGLGGRLDATNIVDADVAVVTSIGLDHADWLGTGLDAIAREKAGIARAGRPVVIGDPAAPEALTDILAGMGASIVSAGSNFGWRADDGTWSAWFGGRWVRGLPLPALAGGYQRANAASALAAILALGTDIDERAVGVGLRSARIPGRYEILPGSPEIVLDVAHNPAAAATLAEALRERGIRGRTYAVLGMYRDKDAIGVLAALDPLIDRWFLAGLSPPRGSPASALAAALRAVSTTLATEADDVEQALALAREVVSPGDRLVVAGSFATVAAARAALDG